MCETSSRRQVVGKAMHMLNRDGSRLFSPIKTMIAAALLLMGIVALTVLIVIAYLSVTATVAKAAEPAGESRIAVSHVTLPNLPEGDYWMVTSVIGVNTNQVQYQVAFSVPQGCPPVTVPLPPPVIDDLSTFWIPTKPER